MVDATFVDVVEPEGIREQHPQRHKAHEEQEIAGIEAWPARSGGGVDYNRDRIRGCRAPSRRWPREAGGGRTPDDPSRGDPLWARPRCRVCFRRRRDGKRRHRAAMRFSTTPSIEMSEHRESPVPPRLLTAPIGCGVPFPACRPCGSMPSPPTCPTRAPWRLRSIVGSGPSGDWRAWRLKRAPREIAVENVGGVRILPSVREAHWGADRHCSSSPRGSARGAIPSGSCRRRTVAETSWRYVTASVTHEIRGQLSLPERLDVAVRALWNRTAAGAMQRLISEFRPDVAGPQALPAAFRGPRSDCPRGRRSGDPVAHDYEFVAANHEDDRGSPVDRIESASPTARSTRRPSP